MRVQQPPPTHTEPKYLPRHGPLPPGQKPPNPNARQPEPQTVPTHGPQPATVGDSEAWDSIVGLLSSQKSDLEQPVDAANDLIKNWDKWGFNKGHTFAVTKDETPDEQKTLAVLNKTPILKAIGADSKGDASNSNQSKGLITKSEVTNFVAKATSEAKQAASDYNAWLKKNPDASDTAKALAQSAAMIEGNATLLSAGDPNPSSLVDGKVTEADLQGIADPSSGISKTLSGAASLWQNPGLFNAMETSGTDQLANNPSGSITSANASAFLKQDSFTTDSQVETMMQTAALTQATAGVDTSKIGPDLFKQDSQGNYVNLGKYTPAQKAAVLAQLSHVEQVLQSGQNAGAALPDGSSVPNVLDTPQLQQAGINPNLNKTLSQVQGDIAALQSDSSTQQYVTNQTDTALQSMTSSDPAFETVMKQSLAHFQSGATLKADINGTHPVTTTEHVGRGTKQVTTQVPNSVADGVNSFATQAAFFQEAFGKGAAPDQQLDLNKIAHNSGEYGTVLQYYQDNIVSGKNLSALTTQAGGDLGQGANAFATQVQNFSALLDPADVQKNATTLGSNYLSQVEQNLSSRSDAGANFMAAFGTNGQFDKAKTTAIVNQLMQQHPETFTDGKGNPVQVNDVVSAIGGVFGAVRGGMIFNDAMKNIGLFGGPAQGNVFTKIYNSGAAHAIGAIFSGVELGITADGQKVSGVNATGVANDIAGGLAVVGFGLIAGGKAYQTATAPGQAAADLQTATNQFNLEQHHVDLAQRDQVAASRALATAQASLRQAQAAPANTPHRTQAIAAAQTNLNTAEAANNEANTSLGTARDQLDTAATKRDLAQAKVNVLAKGGTGLAFSWSTQKPNLGQPYKPDTLPKAAIDLGTGLFGASFVISGGLGINSGVQDLQSGNKLLAGLNLTDGISSTVAGTAYLGEAGLSAAAASGADISTGALAFVDAVAGPMTAVALAVGAGLAIYSAVEEDIQAGHEMTHTTQATISTLNQYGITGGPIQPGDAPPRGR